MFTHERHQVIVDLVAREQRLTVQQIQSRLGVSPATLRRDLTELEKAGHVVRVHGGVVHPQSLRSEPSFSLKSRRAVEAKRAIAKTASGRVNDGETVFVDSGTTCLEIGRLLLARSAVQVVTNSAPLIHEAHQTGAGIIALGGELRPISGAFTGQLALEWLSRLRLNHAFIGASGVDAEGPSTTELSEAAIKSTVIAKVARSKGRCDLVADGSKWNAPASVRFAGWSVFHAWLASEPLPEDARNACQAAQTQGTQGSIELILS